jgi:hypothetical protein
MKRALHFAGRTVNLQTRGLAASELVDFMFGNLSADGNTRAHRTLVLEDSSEKGELCFSVAGIKNPITCGPASQVVTHLLYEVDYHLADRCRDGLYLHAASLSRNGLGLLMPASSGSGKSTLTYWLTRHGFHYSSDESTFIPLNSLNFSGFTRPAHLKKGSLDLFPELNTAPKLEVRQADDSLSGWLISTSALNPLPALPVQTLKSILIPHYQAGADFAYEQLSPARTAFELAGCLTNARNLPQHGFPEIMRLARALPAWRVIYSHVSQVTDLLEMI